MMEKLSKADREYREKLRKFNISYFIAVLFMIVCMVILLIGPRVYQLEISESAAGFLMGFFSSITIVFILFILRNRQIMQDPKKLRMQRIARTDERNVQINGKALRFTSFVMSFVLVLLSMIGSFISRELMYTATCLLWVFLISYLAGYFYFKKKL
ncbi:hypothetical protein [Enterococcus viikkiensis]|uniref:hypothetical protein n=1 Tax=Enterococcus viikkiensis TaxID=930854 RepID=UPI001FE5EC8F|nr:hypothetical protein [Enterococcus viikkiensis]